MRIPRIWQREPKIWKVKYTIRGKVEYVNCGYWERRDNVTRFIDSEKSKMVDPCSSLGYFFERIALMHSVGTDTKCDFDKKYEDYKADYLECKNNHPEKIEDNFRHSVIHHKNNCNLHTDHYILPPGDITATLNPEIRFDCLEYGGIYAILSIAGLRDIKKERYIKKLIDNVGEIIEKDEKILTLDELLYQEKDGLGLVKESAHGYKRYQKRV